MQVKVLKGTKRGTKGGMYIFFHCLLVIAKSWLRMAQYLPLKACYR
jgi:hypothetical protein